MRGIYDFIMSQYSNASKEPNLHQMIMELQKQIESLESRMDSIMNDLETLKEENVKTTNTLYELQNSIEAVDRRIDIVAEDSIKVTEREDGSLDIGWNADDPKYAFLNEMTEEQQSEFFLNAIKEVMNRVG